MTAPDLSYTSLFCFVRSTKAQPVFLPLPVTEKSINVKKEYSLIRSSIVDDEFMLGFSRLKNFTFIFAIFVPGVAEIGPFDALAKSAIEASKDFMERVLIQMRIPKIIQNPQGSGISFQLDDPSEANEQIPECKECKMNSAQALVGTWHVVLWSRNFWITVMSDLNFQLDKLAANQPLPDQRSLFEWLADPPTMLCPQLTVLSASEASKFEFAYTIDPGMRPKSIINKWDRQSDGSILWQLTPKLQAHLCPSIVQQDVVVLRQIDSFPRCNNIIVLLRGDKNYDKVDVIRDMLEGEGQARGGNGLVRTRCDFVVP